jgi:hypothetical protein
MVATTSDDKSANDGLNEEIRIQFFADVDAVIVEDTFTLSVKLACSESQLSSLLLVKGLQGRDVVAVFHLHCYCENAAVYVTGERMIGCNDDSCFNLFVDYEP